MHVIIRLIYFIINVYRFLFVKKFVYENISIRSGKSKMQIVIFNIQRRSRLEDRWNITAVTLEMIAQRAPIPHTVSLFKT